MSPVSAALAWVLRLGAQPRRYTGAMGTLYDGMLDLERYPLLSLEDVRGQEMIAGARASLAEKGVAILPGFVRPNALSDLAREALELVDTGHLEDVAVGTPYLELPDESFPEDHPRRTNIHSKTWVIAYDRIPLRSSLRALYEWEPLVEFVAEVLERRPLYRMADPLGALNYAVMEEGHQQGWHYDNADFIVTLAVQACAGGGQFECAPLIRDAESENYPAVSDVLSGRDRSCVEVFPMTPGTLMIFRGRNSLHRVAPIEGQRPRIIAILAYDAAPDADSSALFKMVRYGRSEPLPPPA